jgi:uncharacterized membrane protein
MPLIFFNPAKLSSPAAVASSGGWRSLAGFWVGGFCDPGGTPVPPDPTPTPTPVPSQGGAGEIVGGRIRRDYANALDRYKAKLRRAQQEAQQERLDELDRIAQRLSDQVEARKRLDQQIESQSRLAAFYDRFAEQLEKAGQLAIMAAAEAARLKRAEMERQQAMMLEQLMIEAEAAAIAEAELQEEEGAIVVLLLLT